MKKILVMMCLFTLVSNLSYGQEWERLPVIFGAYPKDISSNTKGDILLTTAYGIYLSTDRGATWQSNKYIDNSKHELYRAAIDDEGRIFVIYKLDRYSSTGYVGLLTSDSLKLIYACGTEAMIDWVGDKLAVSITGFIDKSLNIKGSIEFKDVLKTKDRDYIAIAYDKYVKVSKDTGNTWKNGVRLKTSFYDSAIDELNNIYLGTNGEGVLKSSDTLKTLTATSLTNVKVFSLVHLNNGELLAGTDYGLMRTKDRAESWESTTLKDRNINKIIYSKNVLYAISDTVQGVYKSTDRGYTWTIEKFGLYDFVVEDAVLSNNGKIFVSQRNEVYELTDYGENYNKIVCTPQISGYPIRLLSAVIDNGLFMMSRNSSSKVVLSKYEFLSKGLETVNDKQSYYISDIIKIDTMYYFFNDGYVHYANDLSKIDKKTFVGNDAATWKLIFHSKYSNNIYTVGSKIGISKDTMKTIKTSTFTVSEPKNIVANSYEHLFLATSANVYRSKDSAKTWTDIKIGLPNGSVINDIAINQDGKLYVATDDGVFTTNSFDDDIFWSGLKNSSIKNIPISKVIVDERDNVYAFSYRHGVYKLLGAGNIVDHPRLISPYNGEIKYSLDKHKIIWEMLNSSDKYIYQVAVSSSFSTGDIILSGQSQGTASADLPMLEFGRSYYWRVKKESAEGIESSWSPIWTFRVERDTKVNDQTTISYFKILPSPVKDVLRIEANSNWETIEIYDIEGKLLFATAYNEIVDVNNLMPGVYYMVLGNKSNRVSKVFVVGR